MKMYSQEILSVQTHTSAVPFTAQLRCFSGYLPFYWALEYVTKFKVKALVTSLIEFHLY